MISNQQKFVFHFCILVIIKADGVSDTSLRIISEAGFLKMTRKGIDIQLSHKNTRKYFGLLAKV